jgi:TonB-linked SusC/RagA family outer membrane protein
MTRRLFSLILTMFCWVLFLAASWSQKTVSGKITSQSDGTALPGVSVIQKGTANGTITDIDGNYSLSVSDNATTLTLSFVGYLSKDVEINNASTVDVILQEDTKQLEAVVVTSFGIKREKKALSYSVTEVSGDDVLKANQPNFLSALQGKVPGALITNSSGAPGAGTSIILRGINSLSPGANNQPLIVIDGMLMSNETVVGNVLPSAGSNALAGSSEQFSQTNRMADLNPNDIESINVLKGAAASALYGSQGSNGVIVITTKKGQAGKPTIAFNTNYSVEELTKSPDLQDLYLDGLSGYKRFLPATVFWQFGPANTANDPLFNNQKDFFQQGSRSENALTLSGGNDRLTYLTSFGYLNHQGVVPNTDFKRLTGRLKSSYKASNWLTLTGSVAYTKSGGLKPNGGDKSVFSALSFHAQSFDVNNYINADGSELDYSAGIIDNPRWLTEFSTFTDNVNRYSTQIAADAQLLPWLTMRYQIGNDAYTDFRKRFAPAASDVGVQIGGYITEENISSRLTTSDLIFTAQKEFNKDLTFRLLAGNQIIDNSFESGFVRGERLSVPNVINIKNGSTFFGGRSDARSRLIGVFADLNLEYKNYLFLTASARNDWTSTLPQGNRSFFYPSVGLSFLFTEALGLSEGILSYGKIRTSYAESGKGTEPHQIGRLYDFSTPFGGIGQTRLSSTISDNTLRPERTKEIELGAELRFFKNRFGIDFTYFTRNSVDLIQPLPVSNTTGYARYVTNVGEIRNRGVELAVNVVPLKTKDFKWDLTFNFTQFSGDVVRISDSIQQFDLYDANPTSTPIAYRYKTGGKVGDLYGFQFRRHSSGALLIGANGYPTVNTTQYVVVGNAIPDFIAAGTTQFTYKGISLSGLFEWRKGGDIVDLSQRNSLRNGILESTERRYEQVVFNGVLADGSKNTIPVEINENTLYRDFNRYNSASEILVQDGSWLRLRNISLGYALPNALLKKLPFSNLVIRLTGNNLWLNTPYRGYDPEGNQFGAGSNVFGFTGFVTPPLRSFTIGLNVNFK